MHYYQVGGWDRQLRERFPPDYRGLAKCLASSLSPLCESGTSPVKLILGIKKSGTVHLLVDEDKVKHLARVNGHKRDHKSPPIYGPVSVSKFESLSPIELQTENEVYKLLLWLKPKHNANQDDSQANRHFLSTREKGISRGAFEHGRVLYRCLHNSIELRDFGIPNKQWLNSLRIFSFAFNLVRFDERSSSERETNPNVIDMGWSEVSLPDLDGKPEMSTHIIISENKWLQAAGKPERFRHGASQTLRKEQVTATLKEFTKTWSQPAQPIILLVHRAKIALNVLKQYGIDIQNWNSGIRQLLYSQNKATSYGRSRSRSPVRAQRSQGWSSQGLSDRYQDVPPRGSVFVLDIESLFKSLMQTADISDDDTVLNIAKALGFKVADGEYCAGNEAMLMFDIWKDMISGLPIDQQREARKQGPNEAPPPTQQPVDADDEDWDPNDIPQGELEAGKSTVSVCDEAAQSDDGQSDSD